MNDSAPSEGPVSVPVTIVRDPGRAGKLPVVILCNEQGQSALRAEGGSGSAGDLARQGALVVLPDVRFFGQLALDALLGDLAPRLMKFSPKYMLPVAKDVSQITQAWERNAIVWGRPLPGMACTDIVSVLDALAARQDVDPSNMKLVSRHSGALSIAALFAAALDTRITSLDLNFAGQCFENRKLPVVPFILEHGDVLQWAALAANRKVTLSDVPREAGDQSWLAAVFAATGNKGGLRFDSR